MTMKKEMQSEDMFVIRRSANNKDKYPVNFRYATDDGTIYTVSSIITKEANSEMRRLITADGTIEDVTVEIIDKDLKQGGAKILNVGNVPEVTPPEESEKDEESTKETDE